MREPGKHTHRLLCLILALVGLMIGAILAPEPAERVSAQVVGSNWSVTGSLNKARAWHTATVLRNGKVLVVGGIQYQGPQHILNSAELYDPTTGKWTETGSLNASRRWGYTATLLPDGRVLVAGGDYGTNTSHHTAEIYDPISETWSFTGNPIVPLNLRDGTVLLPTGKVFIRLGDSLEIYDPFTGKWQSKPTPLGRGDYTTTLLADGRVLVAGGAYNLDDGETVLYDGITEVYDPITLSQSFPSIQLTPRSRHTATLLQTGQVLVAGGWNSAGIVRSCELFDPVTGTWSATGSLPETFSESADQSATTTLLPNGKVLLTGSDDSSGYLRRIHLYDPATGLWSNGGLFPSHRGGYTATLLPNGKVLFTGGISSNNTSLNVAELYDPGPPQVGTNVSVSAASFDSGLADEAIAAGFGAGLATMTSGATTLPLPTSLAGTTVKVKDIGGIERFSPLFFVSPTQVNYQIPAGTSAGVATVTITSGDGAVSSGVAQINRVAPALFTANASGKGVPSAVALRMKADGSKSYEPIAQFDAAQNKFVARPLDLGPEGEQVYLLLFGTGIRNRSSLFSVEAKFAFGIGIIAGEVSYAGAQGAFVGLDQINALVPRSLVGRGEVDILLVVDSQPSNSAQISIK